jgi:hypothetical protein
MARHLSLAGRIHLRLVRVLVPSLDRRDAAEAALVFDEMRSDASRKSPGSWIAVWWREVRSMLATTIDERRRRSNRVAGTPSGGPATKPGGRRHHMSRWSWLQQLISDVRYGGRHLLRSPLFTITSAASVALGIAAVVFVFSAVYAVLWRPLPVAEPDRLVRLAYGNTHGIWSYLGFADASSATGCGIRRSAELRLPSGNASTSRAGRT